MRRGECGTASLPSFLSFHSIRRTCRACCACPVLLVVPVLLCPVVPGVGVLFVARFGWQLCGLVRYPARSKQASKQSMRVRVQVTSLFSPSNPFGAADPVCPHATTDRQARLGQTRPGRTRQRSGGLFLGSFLPMGVACWMS